MWKYQGRLMWYWMEGLDRGPSLDKPGPLSPLILRAFLVTFGWSLFLCCLLTSVFCLLVLKLSADSRCITNILFPPGTWPWLNTQSNTTSLTTAAAGLEWSAGALTIQATSPNAAPERTGESARIGEAGATAGAVKTGEAGWTAEAMKRGVSGRSAGERTESAGAARTAATSRSTEIIRQDLQDH